MRPAVIAAGLALALGAGVLQAGERLTEAPIVWYEDDRRDMPEPAERDPNLTRDRINTSLTQTVHRHLLPSILVRRVGSFLGDGQVFREAANMNAVDEVPNSTWFTNRIGIHPMTPDEAARGAGHGEGPARGGSWTVVRAKAEGVTPGFNIRDANGDLFLIKFDSPGHLGMTTGAGAISARILHAAGYNVPEDVVVTFPGSRLVLGEGVRIRDEEGERAMTAEDLRAILARVETVESGEYRAISSRFLSGSPVGPFDYRGRRRDDPNDRIRHEHRRELRGLRLLAAWINHFDTKQANTLDMYVAEGGRRFLKHYLIDFASTLGAAAGGPAPKYGHEFGWDQPQVLVRLLTAGLHEDDWRKLRRRDDLSEVGYFELESFDPEGFKPTTPNPAFAEMTDRDGYWAAKIISAFTDEHLRAICEAARYRDPAATRYVAETLAGRRDVIARRWFSRVAPIDFFTVDAGSLRARDLGVERGIWPAGSTRYRVRTASADEDRNLTGVSAWREIERLRVPLPREVAGPFHVVELQVDRGEGWGPSVTAYVSRATGLLVAVSR